MPNKKTVVRRLKGWMEVAPSPMVFPQKPSHESPKLETIREDGAEGRDNYDDHHGSSSS